VNEETEVGWGLAGDESLAVWGPEVPKWFLEGEKPAVVGGGGEHGIAVR